MSEIVIIVKSLSGIDFHVPSGIWETRTYYLMRKNPNPKNPLPPPTDKSSPWQRERYQKQHGFYDWYKSTPTEKRVEISLCGRAVLRSNRMDERNVIPWHPHDPQTRSRDAYVCDACRRIYLAGHPSAEGP